MKKVIEKKNSSQTNKVEEKKQRLLYIDILNNVAILAIFLTYGISVVINKKDISVKKVVP